MPGALETLLAVDDQFQRDEQQSADFLHRRDRRYRLDHPEQPFAVDHWLHHLDRLGSSTAVGHDDTRLTLWTHLRILFIAAGALLGLLTMAGLLFYDGGQQINVTLLLGFVALQLLLALVTALQGLCGWQPWRLLGNWLSRRQAPATTDSGYGLVTLRPQLMTLNAQAGGLAFAISAWLTLVTAVVIQDLAFGWSTTLATASADYHVLIQGIAWPWAGWLPAAVPDLQLVTDTRFFRLGGSANPVDAARWGAWWPFLAMTWLFYVILPRLLLLLFAGWHLQRRARDQLSRHPGTLAVQWRMETPVLDTGSQTPDSGQLPADARTQQATRPPGRLAIRWAEAGDADRLTASLEQPSLLVNAGGRQTLSEDRQSLTRLTEELRPEDQTLLLFTRGWEPPTAELADFIEETCQALPRLALALVPLPRDEGLQLTASQQAQWHRLADRLALDGLMICKPGPGPEDKNHDQ